MKVTAWPAFKTKYKNPYNWLLYSQMQRQGIQVEEFSARRVITQKYDICHLHWPVETIVRHPNPVVAQGRAFTMLWVLDWLRFRGTKIVWTIHDETPHSIFHPRIAQWFQQALIARTDGYINLCDIGQKLIQQALPTLKSLPCAIIPHGHYRDIYPNHCDSETAKEKLGVPLDQSLLLFLGYIDYYKNVSTLIKAFRSLQHPGWHLLVAGKVESSELQQEIETLVEGDRRIHLNLKFIPDEDLQFYFQGADLVVLPFSEILNSGSALLALSFSCPILVPEMGALIDLQKLMGSDWVKLYQGPFSADILRSGLEWTKRTSRPFSLDLSFLDWSILSQETIDFYQKLITGD